MKGCLTSLAPELASHGGSEAPGFGVGSLGFRPPQLRFRVESLENRTGALLTAAAVDTGVAVVVAIPHVHAEVLGLVVVERPETLVPTAGLRHRYLASLRDDAKRTNIC